MLDQNAIADMFRQVSTFASTVVENGSAFERVAFDFCCGGGEDEELAAAIMDGSLQSLLARAYPGYVADAVRRGYPPPGGQAHFQRLTRCAPEEALDFQLAGYLGQMLHGIYGFIPAEAKA